MGDGVGFSICSLNNSSVYTEACLKSNQFLPHQIHSWIQTQMCDASSLNMILLESHQKQLFLFAEYMLIMVHVCMACLCAFMCTCMWRSEANTGCLPEFFSTLHFKAGSLREPGTLQFGRDAQEMSFWDPPVSWPCSPALWLQVHATMSGFLCGF